MASAISIKKGARIVALVLLSVVAAPLAARAEQSPTEKQAQALQVEGLRLMQKGENRRALEKFEEAYRLVPSPRILFNRGKAHHALGDDVEALADFERYLDEAPCAPKESRDEATRVIEKLRPKLAYIEVQTDDAGSEITIDLRGVGTAPLARPVVVTRGQHEIRVVKPGMNDEVRSVSVIPGQKLRVVIKLAPTAEKAPAAASPPVAAAPGPTASALATSPAGAEPTPATTSVAKQAEPPAPAVSGGRPWQITAGWVAAGAGALFLGGGITAQVMASSKYDAFNAVTNAPNRTGQCNRMAADNGGGPCTGLLDAGDKRRLFAIVGYVAAGAAAATSVALFLTAPSQSTSRRDVAAACSPNPAGVSCALELSF
ncbi:MAG TPA: tetratricopeptide repeat protein [Polyangia bacterium]